MACAQPTLPTIEARTKAMVNLLLEASELPPENGNSCNPVSFCLPEKYT